ncbi:MlaC/ttg2D family ABC transporter substrate-binding protein [Oleiagrimonas soli]|uniref:Phospholipid transport system substrate-binding protein n=1 Tax=Oleiagrimonas soli TaxID=1543381 RepID=A0A099CV00_9GAMM|nr:ABC transporter substrate-binding protein [Oleiagrimonas soli]KGI76850.1 toluene tolerance protein [Oleiagrimonas soli]MBB6185295.1 phospholipid transport system substrate-binding protein [Oleiagrimonas soli]
MKLRNLVLACALFAPGALLASPAPAPAAATSAPAVATPQQVVENITSELANAIDGHRAELKQDKNKLIGVIDGIFLPHFDIDYASILVLGRHAREATPAQRERFAKAFYDSITHRYAEGLLNYTKGSVKVLPSKGALNDRRTMVRTQVMLDDGKTISVDYAFRKTSDGQWKAYDVVIEGISYITNYRAQVDAEVRKMGIEGLIERLEKNGADTLDKMQKDAAG